jgi:acyl carrier protein
VADDPVFTWVQARFADVLELEPADITPDSQLAADLDADSIDLIEVVNGAEKEFGVSIEEQELYDLETVSQLVELIEAARKG